MSSRRILTALAATATLLAAPIAHAEPGDELTISVLTFGPGDHPFFKFGHNAILVNDASRRDSRRDMVYNFGTFGFESWTLIPNFFRGKLKYWLSIQSLSGTIALYREENRTITQQVLDLTPAQRRELAESLASNARPENKYYKYDYYGDNCSTRVRDAVDKVVMGRVRAASTDKASMSFRAHTRRLTADDIPVYLGLHAAMGDYIDKPITVWEEMFLPVKVEETLRKTTIPGPSGDVPLVKAEIALLGAPGRAPLRPVPPSWTLRMLAVGTVIGGALAALGRAGTKVAAARVALGSILAFGGFVLGFLGCLFVMFWTLTDHQVAYRNENILQCAPWVIALAGVGVGLARGKAPAMEKAWKLTRAAAAASILGLVCKVLPFFDQNNSEIIALMLPVWVGAAAGTWFLRSASVTPAPAVTPAPVATPSS